MTVDTCPICTAKAARLAVAKPDKTAAEHYDRLIAWLGSDHDHSLASSAARKAFLQINFPLTYGKYRGRR